MTIERIGLLGFGEVGQTLAADLAGRDIAAFDVQFVDRASIPSRALARHPNVTAAGSAIEACRGADLVISAVTAAEDLNAARAAAGGLGVGSWFVDLNSVAPATRRAVAAALAASEARYVEAAVMSPIAPKRIASPILLGGPYAAAFLPVGAELGFSGVCVCSDEIGPASATKMCRSVIIKGLEALLAESLVAARRYGVDAAVLASLDDLLPGHDWPALARYMISRSVMHGVRRAEEMREAAIALGEAGIEPLMSAACVERQRWAARFGDTLAHQRLPEFLDAILAQLAIERGDGRC